MPSVRVILVVALVVVIMLYLMVLINGGGYRLDGFANLQPSEAVFTLYYMTGCPHCEKILPDYNKFESAGPFVANGKNVKIRKVEQSQAPDEVAAKKISGFPTLVLTTAEGKDIEYSGDRNSTAYKAFISQNAV